MKMSPHGRSLLEQREGNILHAYQDTVGVWTIGYGHTHFDGPPIPVAGMKISQQEADDMLTRDLTHYENLVNQNVTVLLTQNEFDALVSICYNVESALSSRSSIVRSLNRGDKKAAAEAIMLYNKPPEIIGRRRTEQKQFMTPYATMPLQPHKKAAGVVIAAGGTATVIASSHPHLWPWVLGGVIIAGIATYLYFHFKSTPSVIPNIPVVAQGKT